MEFFDQSEITRQLVTDAVGPDEYIRAGFPSAFIQVSVRGGEGIGLSATNLGLSDHEVGIGFAAARNSQRAREFSDIVIVKLNERWDVHYVEYGKGMFPLESCRIDKEQL